MRKALAVLAMTGVALLAAGCSEGGETSGYGFGAAAVTADEQTTTAAAAAAPKPTMKKISHTGRGDDVVDIDTGGQLSILSFTCNSCTSNTVVKTDGGESLLVNTIGAYRGKHLININDNSDTTRVTVQADSPWSLTVEDWREAASRSTSGSGDEVLFITDGTKAEVTNRGEGNFVVRNICSTGADLAVNEIGSYSGTIPLEAPCLVQIESDGDWTFRPS